MKNSKQVVFRSLKLDDYSFFSAIRAASLSTHPTAFAATNKEEAPILEDRFKSTMQHPKNFIQGAFDGKELAGITGFIVQDKVKLAHRGNIWGVYIKESHKGQGIGRDLMESTLTKAWKLPEITQIYLSVLAENKPAVNLYKSVGFETYGTEVNALQVDGKFYDDLLMVKFRP